MALKLILGAICVLAGLLEFNHSRWVTKNLCTCGECAKASQLGPFNRMVGITAIIAMMLIAIPSPLPICFFAGFKFAGFVSNRIARRVLA